MKWIIALLLIFGLVFSTNPPACPNYPYRDFTWASDYSSPVRPTDTLLGNCRNIRLNDTSLCSIVNSSNLTIAQKKQFLLDGLMKSNDFPPFSEANAWNANISFTKYAPDGTQMHNGTYIKDAWVRITSLFPSVLEESEKQTYVNATGTLSMAKGFTFVVPREQFGGDCRTDYAVCGYNYALSAYANWEQLAQNQSTASYVLQNLTHGASADFTAHLSINSQYFIHHYHLVRHCYGRGRNIFCITTCDYASTEDRRDSLEVSDAKAAYIHNFTAYADVFVDSYRQNLSDAWLRITSSVNYSNALFKIGNSSLKLQARQYKLGYDLPPYNALVPVSIPIPSRLQAKGASILSNDGSKIHFLAPTTNLNCTLEINSHFTRQVFPNACRYNATQQPMINLTVANATNSSFVALAYFYDNTTGQPLSAKNLTFSYANLTRSAITNASGAAQLAFPRSRGASLVSASFITDFETKSARAYAVVPSELPDIASPLLFMAALAVALWLAYLFLKRWFA